jgi:hypothetical protein
MEVRPNIDKWIYMPGLPADHPVPVSDRFEKVDSVRMAWESEEITAAQIDASEWSTHEWLHFLRGISEDQTADDLAALDSKFELTNTGNSEIAFAWFMQSIAKDYQPAFPSMETFLNTVGRRKFLKPIYESLSKTKANKEWAIRVYTDSRPNYHSVSVVTIDEILEYES